jgi:hypothetical protein
MTLSTSATPNKASAVVAHWKNELQNALTREKQWRKAGATLVDIYECGKEVDKHPYNILYSNTETLSPALYNSAPRPAVKPRFVQKDNALTRLAALMGQRILQHGLDNGDPGVPEFDEMMRGSVTESLVPGRGLMRVRYAAIFKPAVSAPEETPEAPEQVESESCTFEPVAWDDFLHGFGKTWQDVPWVAFRHYMTKEDLEANFKLSKSQLSAVLPSGVNGEEGDGNASVSLNSLFRPTEAGGQEQDDDRTTVWEIWDKLSKQVLFISTTEAKPWKQVPDPCKLQGFFPVPRPLQLFRKLSGLTPQSLYESYRQQAEELNDITIRITKITRAMRIRGFYNSSIEELKNLMSQDDNVLLPITNAGQITAQGLKLDDAIWLFPLEKLVGVLQQLYAQRSQIKSVIFELTGIADIMRGSSQASETLGAQEIKNQWGTLRLKRMQKEVARFSRDCLRLYLELVVTHISPELIRAMTGLPFPTQAEQDAMKQEYMAAAQQAQMAQQPVPPQPPELAAPPLEVIIQTLQTDMLRNFSIDVETNSTVDAEATEDKQDMAELMNALAQFLNGVAPIVQAGALPEEAAKLILLNLLRRFRMGGEIEEAVMAAKPPSQGGEAEKAQLQQMQEALGKERETLDKEKQAVEVKKREVQMMEKEAQQSIAMEREFAVKEVQMAQRMSQKQLDQEKQFAIREVKMAQQEAAAFSSSDPGPVTPSTPDLP